MTTLPIVFQKSPDLFAHCPQMINETNKCFSKRFYTLKMIPWTRRIQCRQLGRKKNRKRTDQFAINVRNRWEKNLLDFFTTILSNRQTESSTDNGTNKFLSKWQAKIDQCPMTKKKKLFEKKFFKKPSWARGKQLWQICWLFFDGKNTYFSVHFVKNMKKNKKHFVKNKVMSSQWSFGLVKCSSAKLTEKFSKKPTHFFWMSENDGRKTFLTKKFFTIKCCNGQTESSFDDTAEKFLSKCQKKKRPSVNDEQKMNLFEEKALQRIALTNRMQVWQTW